MWYFAWILGLGLALAFGIINVMWLEASYTYRRTRRRDHPAPVRRTGAPGDENAR